MINALLVLLLGTGLTGYLMTTDVFWGAKWVEDVHEALANLTVGLIVFHVVGVLISSAALKMEREPGEINDYRLETAYLIFKAADDVEIAIHDQPAIVSYFRGRSPRTKQRRLSNRVDLDQPARGRFDQGAPTPQIYFRVDNSLSD
jgi:hypothetical protein